MRLNPERIPAEDATQVHGCSGEIWLQAKLVGIPTRVRNLGTNIFFLDIFRNVPLPRLVWSQFTSLVSILLLGRI